MTDALRNHWPEYLMEAGSLGFFMMSACLFGVILEYPASPIRQILGDPLLRRMFMGAAMGLTAIGIVYSPWGKQSGAHINPSVTLTFYRLGKVQSWDAFFYIAAHFVGACTGVVLARVAIGNFLSHPHVNYVVTEPGAYGTGIAFMAEMVISFILMIVVLYVSNKPNWHRFTGLCAGFLVANYITFEAPLSGMSMNPARTFGSAFTAQKWTALWLYFIAPAVGMQLAAAAYLRMKGAKAVACAKLHHKNSKRCIFCGKSASGSATWLYPASRLSERSDDNPSADVHLGQ